MVLDFGNLKEIIAQATNRITKVTASDIYNVVLTLLIIINIIN